MVKLKSRIHVYMYRGIPVCGWRRSVEDAREIKGHVFALDSRLCVDVVESCMWTERRRGSR